MSRRQTGRQLTGPHPVGGPTRRGLLQAGGVTLAGVMLPGCDALSTDPAGEGANRRAGDTDAKEAPYLTDRVDKGELPELSARLPETPLVVEPHEEPGGYGDELRMLVVGTEGIDGLLDRTIGYDHLVRWAPTMDTWTADDVLPDIAESYEVNADATEYVFRLRPGMKWSDGQPFGPDDIVFWYEDVVTNPDITPVFPTWLQSGEEPFSIDKVDGQTVRFTFSTPNGLLLGNIAAALGFAPTRHPAHYLKDFHPKYATDDLDSLAKEAGLDRWADLFLQKASPWENPELPVLSAWQVTKGVGEVTNRLVAVRNPYYWKVDDAGRQLPYIDEVVFDLVADNEVAKLKVLSGEVDLVYSTIMMDLRDKPIISKGQEDGGYRILDLIYEDSNTMAFSLNLAHRDPDMRSVLSELDFRVGLSHAINREEIIDAVFQQQGVPHQVAPHPDTAYYNEELSRQYTEYSVELANEHLDRVLPDKDDDGKRLGPNGKPFTFDVDVSADTRPRDVATLELMREYFLAVGVDMRIKSEAGALFWERLEGNLHDAAVFGSGGGLDPVYQPDFMLPIFGATSMYAVPWSYWYAAGGLKGAIPDNVDGPIEEPPPAAQEQMELYDQLKATSDTEEQMQLMIEIIKIAQEQFWCIGISLPAGNYGVVSNRLQNVPNPMIDDWPWQTPGPTNLPQYFVRA